MSTTFIINDVEVSVVDGLEVVPPDLTNLSAGFITVIVAAVEDSVLPANAATWANDAW